VRCSPSSEPPADGLGLLHVDAPGRGRPGAARSCFSGRKWRHGPPQRVEAGMSFVNRRRPRSVARWLTVEENLIFGQNATRAVREAGLAQVRFHPGQRGPLPRRISRCGCEAARSFRPPQHGRPARESSSRARCSGIRCSPSWPFPRAGLGLEAQEYVRKALVLQCERGSGLLWLTEDPRKRSASRTGSPFSRREGSCGFRSPRLCPPRPSSTSVGDRGVIARGRRRGAGVDPGRVRACTARSSPTSPRSSCRRGHPGSRPTFIHALGSVGLVQAWSGDVILVFCTLLFLGMAFTMPLHAGVLNLGI